MQSNLLAFYDADLTRDRRVLNLWVVSLDAGAREAVDFLGTEEYEESDAAFSPNGDWIAYVSDRGGRAEVWAQPYPVGARILVSTTGGGREPLWARDGSELFFRDGYRMMAAVFDPQADRPFSEPVEPFPEPYELAHREDMSRNYDVASDGRFLMVENVREPIARELRVIFNWFTELEALVPTGR